MFRLTRQERLLVIGVLFAFVTGLVVQHVRTRNAMVPPDPPHHANQ